FLLQHFQKVFITQGQSHIVEQRYYPLYKLVALDAIVNVKYLPTGFNTTHLPSPNNCDLCNKPLIANNH
ncbi:14737_t:CDS:1, partial [Funneliformis mosseae]